ncbi:purE phosphoribosylaminoimidazole carboxylase (EC 4.1.1.21) [Pyrococcus abyssi GE5]|uniref:N5-carboxyaminoimidazole ribonucleotide mutase n=2 Tax=Pyrococcus abyssi TaxID=29292 RepID=PURE_PYRAB|nr:RecName: Full=N5-carboxyaminoimidazole ribonucleotide mutase; Short=N5-CAIR mutase; AltName: Full=5-(carboxyamino)imidazole ribonucleotide mutase [Pyrococcus abyssi GE5]CAB50544.1 purE phosphoribosylaminoimidazole carboxylase (EC 4.1.1.21) [Pyrococcus abyssi GE5]CCE71101.1 TPA: phosphoribosylaminoimidazole carboxylase catalytic subunit [Pyrococcus abyssi GE5]
MVKVGMPKVGIIMGSDSDLPVMKEAAKVLEDFEVDYEMKVISAHRTPERLHEYARTAEERGIEVIIAGAGGAAHLPGVLAALTMIPVIGVPIKSKALNGLDSLLSIVQMPPGIPVATVGIDGAKNAALLALEILSIKYPEIKEKLKKYREDMKRKVEEKSKKLEELGWRKYLEG